MKKLSQKGFTLVEIVIVLAIAGLIMVIVFVGVQGAQRSRRDAVRRSDAARFQAAVEQYSSNNNGAIPTTVATVTTLVGSYLRVGGSTFADPVRGNYGVGLMTTRADVTAANGSNATSAGLDTEDWAYSNGQVCNGAVMTAGGGTNWAMIYALEVGGNVCVDND